MAITFSASFTIPLEEADEGFLSPCVFAKVFTAILMVVMRELTNVLKCKRVQSFWIFQKMFTAAWMNSHNLHDAMSN